MTTGPGDLSPCAKRGRATQGQGAPAPLNPHALGPSQHWVTSALEGRPGGAGPWRRQSQVSGTVLGFVSLLGGVVGFKRTANTPRPVTGGCQPHSLTRARHRREAAFRGSAATGGRRSAATQPTTGADQPHSLSHKRAPAPQPAPSRCRPHSPAPQPSPTGLAWREGGGPLLACGAVHAGYLALT